jgi:hypothetical protein
VRRKQQRRLEAARLADLVGGDPGGQRVAGLEGAEPGVLAEPLPAGRVAPDGGLHLAAEATPDRLGAAHVVRDRDEDREPLAELAVDQLEHRIRLGRQQRVDQHGISTGAQSERRDLAAELARVPLRMARGPAPETVGDLLGSERHGGSITAHWR